MNRYPRPHRPVLHPAFVVATRTAVAIVVLGLSALHSGPGRADDARPGATTPSFPAELPASQTGTAQKSSRLHVYNRNLDPHWIAGEPRFWYRRELPGDGSEFILVDASSGVREPAFDHARVAGSLSVEIGHAVSPERLPVDFIDWKEGGVVLLHGAEGSWSLELSTYSLSRADPQWTEGLPFSRTPRPSTQSGGESEITFVNRLDQTVRIYWLDGSADRTLYMTLPPGARHAQHTYAGHVWLALDSEDEIVAVFEATDRPELAILDGREPAEEDPGTAGRGPERRAEVDTGPGVAGTPSPDGRWAAFSRDDDLWLLDLSSGAERRLSRDGSPRYTYSKTNQRERSVELEYDAEPPPAGSVDVGWSPDSRHLIALRSPIVPERNVYMIESSPEDQVQPRLLSYPYLKPGDEIPVRRPHLFDVASGKELPLDDRLYSSPWGLYEFRWTPEGDRCLFLYNQRGHQLMRVIEIDATSGRTRAIVDESCATFFDYSSKTFLQHLDETDELLWMSERDGWNHLYLYDRRRGEVKNQVTRGDWVVQGVDRVDPESRRIWFRAVGIVPGQDPYFVQHCRVDFDGANLVVLTETDERQPGEQSHVPFGLPLDTNGTHEIEWSPDGNYIVDTWSRVDLPPVHVLRDGQTGALLCELERADASEFLDAGRGFPEPFVARGRDGVTPVYGIIHRPHDFDPKKSYPVIENIYAGPHDQHVPKSFHPTYSTQSLADRGFIVVQIDGMGTNWRSKAFHDVCWKNLVDAGLPDRIAWIRAAAARYSFMDTTRVGIYGGSAGGQSALGALLTHGDFYKVAVADCGCHDNRMDKVWWSEQWMGYPVGPHYEAQSNVTLAPGLEGELLLIVGELDRNVDPASTMQVVHALIEADKDFEMLVIPGAGHGTAGTEYGRRRLEEFFVEHLKPFSR